jgi:hypothetical protein
MCENRNLIIILLITFSTTFSFINIFVNQNSSTLNSTNNSLNFVFYLKLLNNNKTLNKTEYITNLLDTNINKVNESDASLLNNITNQTIINGYKNKTLIIENRNSSLIEISLADSNKTEKHYLKNRLCPKAVDEPCACLNEWFSIRNLYLL